MNNIGIGEGTTNWIREAVRKKKGNDSAERKKMRILEVKGGEREFRTQRRLDQHVLRVSLREKASSSFGSCEAEIYPLTLANSSFFLKF